MYRRSPAAAATTTEPLVLLATARQSAPAMALRVMSCQLPSSRERMNKPEVPLPRLGAPAAAIRREPAPVSASERQFASRRVGGDMAVAVSPVSSCKAPRWLRLLGPWAVRKYDLLSPCTAMPSAKL